jgi:hypothetical protein
VLQGEFLELVCKAACNSEVDPMQTYFTDQVSFYFNYQINTQNNRYWSEDNARLIKELPLNMGYGTPSLQQE